MNNGAPAQGQFDREASVHEIEPAPWIAEAWDAIPSQTRGVEPEISATPYVWRDASTIPVRPWLLGRWLLRGTAATVIAPGGAGKTTLIATAALSLVTGRPLLGKKVWDGPGRVWIWNLEDDRDELSRSIQASAMHYRIKEEEVAGRLFLDIALEGRELCTAIDGAEGFKIIEPVYAGITAEILDRQIDVLIVDPFVSSHKATENNNAQIDEITKKWVRVGAATNSTVILVHHTSKAGSGEVTALSSRGASSMTAAVRSALVLNRMEKDEAERLGIASEERHRYVSVCDDKHNRAPAEKADWYLLTPVDLGNAPADNTRPSDSVAVAVPWTAPNPFDDITVQHLAAVQAAVAGGEWKEHHTAADWVGLEIIRTLGLDEEVKAHRAKVKSLIKTWINEGALTIVERQDRNRQWKKFVEVGRQVEAGATPMGSVA